MPKYTPQQLSWMARKTMSTTRDDPRRQKLMNTLLRRYKYSETFILQMLHTLARYK